MHFTAILVGLTAIASAVEIRPLGQLNDIVNFSKTVVLQHPDDLNQLANLTKSKQMHQVRFQWCSNSWDDTSCGMRELTHKVCYDLDVMDKTLAFRPMRLISIANGACVLYNDFECEGKTSDILFGQNLVLDNTCEKRKLTEEVLSIRCCHMTPEEPWCHGSKKKLFC